MAKIKLGNVGEHFGTEKNRIPTFKKIVVLLLKLK